MPKGRHGDCSATTDGQRITYTPNADFVGEDQFTYFVSDGKDGTAAGTVRITVTGPNGPNRAPTASDDVATTSKGVAVTIDVLANDADADGDTLSVLIESQPEQGTAVVQNEQIVYTPNADFVGEDPFTYAVSDGKGGTAVGTVRVTVTAVPGETPGRGQPTDSTLHLPIIAKP